MRRRLELAADVGFVFLFGSFAKGRQRAGSDVDLGIWIDPAAVPSAVDRADRALDLEAELERELARVVQVVVLNDAPDDLAHNVLSHGRLVLEADPEARRRHFVDHASRWLDMEHARRLFDRALAKRIDEGTFGG